MFVDVIIFSLSIQCMRTQLIKIYHGFQGGKKAFLDFLIDVNKTMKEQSMSFGVHYHKGELLYSVDANDETMAMFDSQFYADFPEFQIVPERDALRAYDMTRTSVGQLYLEHDGFFPFAHGEHTDSSFVTSILRTLENCDIATEKMSYVVQIVPVKTESFVHYMKQKFAHRVFRWYLRANFVKYVFMRNISADWKKEGGVYYKAKKMQPQFAVRIAIIAQSSTKAAAEGKIRTLFNKFLVFKKTPHNQFLLRIMRGLSTA